MTDERFEELVNGSLAHPLLPFRCTRLMLALRVVIEAHPDAEKAFVQYCTERVFPRFSCARRKERKRSAE